MKKWFSRYRIALFVLSVMTSVTFADQIWRGTSAFNVLDEDVVIKDDVLLNLGSTRIEAVHRDVTVTLTKNVTISGHWAGESQLYLMAAEGRTIRFVLDHDIKFVGSSSVTKDDLLIVQSGPGVVEMALAGGNAFTITSQESSGGVQMYVLMYGGETAPCDEYCPDEEYCSNKEEYLCDEYCSLGNGFNENSLERPRLQFVSLSDLSRMPGANREIIIGKKSRLSFLSSRKTAIAQDSGIISFDPSSDTAGRMVLIIRNTGAFVASGHYTCQRNGGLITLAAIDLATPAGWDARWAIVNSRGEAFSAGLLVLNENNELFDLLVDPFLNLGFNSTKLRSMTDEIETDDYLGNRFGVVVGANGSLVVNSDSYLDFVGLALNKSPKVDCVPGAADSQPSNVLKKRNPSALFIDGNNDPASRPACFSFQPRSAVFFRSGVDKNGFVRFMDDADPFTIDAAAHTPGIGNIVFDVEGMLNVDGVLVNGSPSSKIELLSLEVAPTGGSLFVGSPETNFPLRTFNTEDEEYLAYNTGAFLINNVLNLYNTALSHTDVNHTVIQNNDVLSEPTYVGGETYRLTYRLPNNNNRPNIRFFNSDFLINADVALTGLDLVVPNQIDSADFMIKNKSNFVFYSNGSCIDNGTGRNMILGTRIGSTAADGISRINGDAHLDIMELFNAMGTQYPSTDIDNQVLRLRSDFNDASISNMPPQPGNSINTIYLGNNSNISIGVNDDVTGLNIDTNPWLQIQGNYFSFTSRGGMTGCPNMSNLTGQGGIFVDLNGQISIDPGCMANFCTMVTKSHNGIVDLPAGQALFCNGFGVADWDVDLTDNKQVIIPAGQSVGDYVFNWNVAKKDCAHYSPYQINGCFAQQAIQENVSSLPIIKGNVSNLIIQGTRLGDAAAFIIDGGTVRNIEFAVDDCCSANSQCVKPLSAQAPVATVILQNNGSLDLSGQPIGSNGITIIANGSGTVTLNASDFIGFGASFVKGPNFTSGDVLRINASTSQELVLPSGGSLDLTSFNATTDLVEFIDNISLIVEPGAKIITGLGTLSFAGSSQLNFEPAASAQTFFDAIAHGAHDETLPPLNQIDAANTHNQYDYLTNFGKGLSNTDAFRVRLMGQGVIQLRNNASASLPTGSFVGVESLNQGPLCSLPTTDLEIRLLDSAQFTIGNLASVYGGVLQVGNVTDLNAVTFRQKRGEEAQSVSFTLTINGANAIFSVGSQGFMGLGVGIERFFGTDAACTGGAACIVPNENIVNTLFNVDSITFNFLAGRFDDSRIFRGDDSNASLFAISGDSAVSYAMNLTNTFISPFNLTGGGNMVLVYPGVGGIHPVVLDQDGQVEVAPGVLNPRLWVSILASTLLQDNELSQTGLTGLEFFDVLKTHDAVLETNRPNTFGRANAGTVGQIARPVVDTVLIDTVSQGAIIRGETNEIIGAGLDINKEQLADETGAVAVNIDQATNEIITVTLLNQ